MSRKSGRACRGALRGARVRCVRTAALFWVLFWCQKSTAAHAFRIRAVWRVVASRRWNLRGQAAIKRCVHNSLRSKRPADRFNSLTKGVNPRRPHYHCTTGSGTNRTKRPEKPQHQQPAVSIIPCDAKETPTVSASPPNSRSAHPCAFSATARQAMSAGLTPGIRAA